MTLTPGTQLGSYEITTLLGSGGMGEAYRAKNLKLGRDVAIKVLREELAADPERLRPFEQEARCASDPRQERQPGAAHLPPRPKNNESCEISLELAERFQA